MRVNASNEVGLNHFFFQTADFLLKNLTDPVLGQINMLYPHAEGLSDLLSRPLLDHVELKKLVLLWVNVVLDFGNSGLEKGLLPFLIPDLIQALTGRIHHLFHNASARRIAACQRLVRASRTTFAYLVDNAPTSHV